jgi:large subunit ribosomal protein L18
MKMTRKERLNRRHMRVRSKVAGTPERPRLMVRKSLRHLYVQLIDDSVDHGSRTLYTRCTVAREAAGKQMCNVKGASELGKAVAADLKHNGFAKIVFDRGGYAYHGVVKALAEAIRAEGIQF